MAKKINDPLPPFSPGLLWLGGEGNAPTLTPNTLVLVHFWSVSCPSCKVNMPDLQFLRDKYAAHGLQTVAVHMPRGEADKDVAAIRSIAAEIGLTEPCAVDNDGALADAFGVTAMPTYFLFGTDHTMRRRALGGFGVSMMRTGLERLRPDAA